MELEEFIKQNKKHCKKSIIGKSEGQKPIYALRLRKGKGLRKKAMLVSYLHGNESETLNSNLCSLANMLDQDLLKFWELISIPIANPDGRQLKKRQNAKGVDLNKDFIYKTAKETKIIAQFYQDVKPEIILDYHSNLSNKFSCIIIPRHTEPKLCKDILSSYSQIREQTNLATNKFITDKSLNSIAKSLGQGLYMLEEPGKGMLIEYADQKSRIAAAIEEYNTDLGIEFSTELLKNYKR